MLETRCLTVVVPRHVIVTGPDRKTVSTSQQDLAVLTVVDNPWVHPNPWDPFWQYFG